MDRVHASWGLGAARRWDLDQESGVIAWSAPGCTATAPAQVLGTFAPRAGTWLWAWANRSLLSGVSRDSRSFCDWAQANGHPGLARPRIDADERTASVFAALAIGLIGVGGYYRAPVGASSYMAVVFGPVTVRAVDGGVRVFDGAAR